jgi:hypothetical protein
MQLAQSRLIVRAFRRQSERLIHLDPPAPVPSSLAQARPEVRCRSLLTGRLRTLRRNHLGLNPLPPVVHGTARAREHL